MNLIFNEDCILGMARHLPDCSVDLVVAGPPLGIELGPQRANYNPKRSRVLGGDNGG